MRGGPRSNLQSRLHAYKKPLLAPGRASCRQSENGQFNRIQCEMQWGVYVPHTSSLDRKIRKTQNPVVHLTRSVSILILLGMAIVSCQAGGAPMQRIEETAFGKMPDGRAVRLFTLR